MIKTFFKKALNIQLPTPQNIGEINIDIIKKVWKTIGGEIGRDIEKAQVREAKFEGETKMETPIVMIALDINIDFTNWINKLIKKLRYFF